MPKWLSTVGNCFSAGGFPSNPIWVRVCAEQTLSLKIITHTVQRKSYVNSLQAAASKSFTLFSRKKVNLTSSSWSMAVLVFLHIK
jgi:hypothetical protein